MNRYNEILSKIDPTISDRSLADTVIKKANIRKRAALQKLIIAVIVAGLLTGMTITAGAISNWDYPAIARFFFGGSKNVVEGMHNEMRYQVVVDSNKINDENSVTGSIKGSGFSIELTGLYADEKSILIAFDIIADEPVFEMISISERGGSLGSGAGNNGYFFNNTLDLWEPTYSISKSYRSNGGNLAKAVYRITRLSNDVKVGNVYTLMFYGIELFLGTEDNGDHILSNPIGNGPVEINFVIDTLAMGNNLTVYPGITLENGNIITEMYVSPFAILLHFDGIEEAPTLDDSWIVTDIISADPDNVIIEARSYNNYISAVKKDGSALELINVTSESISDINTQKTWIRFDIDFTQTLNVDDIFAIIYRGIELPLE